MKSRLHSGTYIKMTALLLAALLMLAGTHPSVVHAQEGEVQETPETAAGAEDDVAPGQDTAGEDVTEDDGDDAESDSSTQTVITLVGRYDSADTAAIVRLDERAQTVTLRNHDTGRNYTLSYDNASHITDAYGREITTSQLQTGDLVDVTFLKSSKHLNSLSIASGEGVFVIDNLRDYTLPVKISAYGPSVESMATVQGAKYLMDLRTLVLVDDKESYASQIVDGDTITVSGVGREVYAVKVTRGHGYLRLSSDTVSGTSLVGAWIELDNVAIRRITSGMLMTAPEGDYTLYIVGNGANYAAPVTITRGRETIVDTSLIPIVPVETGDIRFEITPAEAVLRVDGTVMEKGVALPLEYGIHVVELTAEGYDTMIRYLRVGSPSAVVRLIMEGDGTSNGSAATQQSAAAGTSSSSARTSSASSAGSGSGTAGSGTAGSSTEGSVQLSSGGSTSGTAGTDNGGTGVSSGNGNNNNNNDNSNSNNGGNNNNNNNGDNSNNNNSNNNNSNSGNNDNQNNNNGNGNSGNNNNGNNNNGNNNNNQDNNTVFVDGYRVYVDAPRGVRLYLDGNFTGYVPTSFDKQAGIHTVTLQQDGYRTISYNIEIDNGKSDKTFHFPELTRE